MSPIKNVALINELGQVVNHVVVDTDDAETIAGLHTQWGTTRYVETTEDDVIILHKDDDIWTEHCDNPACDNHGFNLPDAETYLKRIGAWVEAAVVEPIEEKEVNGKKYPIDSKLLKSNAHLRPEGYVFPEGLTEVDDTK